MGRSCTLIARPLTTVSDFRRAHPRGCTDVGGDLQRIRGCLHHLRPRQGSSLAPGRSRSGVPSRSSAGTQLGRMPPQPGTRRDGCSSSRALGRQDAHCTGVSAKSLQSWGSVHGGNSLRITPDLQTRGLQAAPRPPRQAQSGAGFMKITAPSSDPLRWRRPGTAVAPGRKLLTARPRGRLPRGCLGRSAVKRTRLSPCPSTIRVTGRPVDCGVPVIAVAADDPGPPDALPPPGLQRGHQDAQRRNCALTLTSPHAAASQGGAMQCRRHTAPTYGKLNHRCKSSTAPPKGMGWCVTPCPAPHKYSAVWFSNSLASPDAW